MSEPTPSGAAAPTELAGLAGAAATLDQAAAPPPVASPAAPGGPAAPPEMSSAQLIEMVARPWWGILAPNWNVSKDEQQLLAEAYGGALDHFYPGWAMKLGPLTGVVFATSAVFGPRLAMKIPPRLEEKKTDAKTKTDDAPAAS